MRIELRKTWKRMRWVGPAGERGNGSWSLGEDLGFDSERCARMNAAYPGWTHSIEEHRGTPKDRSVEGWVLHPLFGDMQFSPFDVRHSVQG